MCWIVGTVGAAEANPGIPEGRYSNPADNQKLPILATYTDPHGKAAANISRDKTDRFSAGTMHLVCSSFGELLICTSFGEEGLVR